MRNLVALALVLLINAPFSYAKSEESLRLFSKEETKKQYTINRGEESITVTRKLTPCALNRGWLQPMIPAPGITPVGSAEVLKALNDQNSMVIDMRLIEQYEKETIPHSVNIQYGEITSRMDELGCQKSSTQWRCDSAKKIYGFCNGPTCPQSIDGFKALLKAGFPKETLNN